MTVPRFILIDGKPYAWRDLVALRRAQLAAYVKADQPALFELIEDHRPSSQISAAGRYSEPLLFDCDQHVGGAA